MGTNAEKRTNHSRRHLAAAALLAVAAFSALPAAGERVSAAAGFYVWQRDITPAVLAAVRAASAEGRELFVLAGEFDRAEDGSLREPVPVPRPPFDFGSGNPPDAPPATAVFRVHAAALDDPARTGAALAARATGLGALRVQLDVDAPERRLHDYAALTAAVRAGLPPGAELSLTLLPCHFAHPDAVRTVLAAADWGVLQLHGIDPPRSLSDAWRLMEPATVRTALERARDSGMPLRMALPAYAYVLQFAPDGTFRRLWAEGYPGSGALAPGDTVRLAAPDLSLLAALFSDTNALPAIWFRLPVPGTDRWCLDRDTLRELEAGRVPSPAVVLDTDPLPAGNGFRLFATFRHAIPLEAATESLPWRDASRVGEWMSLGGCTADGPPGRLPESVVFAPHACGERFPVAVVLSANRLVLPGK